MTSRTERYLVFASPRLRQGLDMGDNCLKEIRKRPPEKTRRWRRAIRSATIEVMQHRPHLGAPLGQSTMMMMHWRQRAVAPFDRRRGTLKGAHPVGSPCLPLFEGLGRKALGERMMAKGNLPSLQCLPYFGFPAGTARVGHLVLPIDKREQELFSPLPPHGGDGRVCQITSDPFPPEVHQGRQAGNGLRTLVMAAWRTGN